jgi:hypothetical protein
MQSQCKAEFELAHSRWITNRNPPEPGHYLVRVQTTPDEYGVCGKPFVRIERWDGTWCTLGGHVRLTGWMPLPAV